MHRGKIEKLAQDISHNDTILLSFGCSWTFGTGLCYTNDTSEKDYINDAWNNQYANKYSYRTLISQKFNFYNLNYAEGRSSNQRQFRFARELFSDPMFQEVCKMHKVVVMWAITSTCRNEFWSNTSNEYYNFKHDDNLKSNDLPFALREISKLWIDEVYKHDREVEELSQQMTIWNGFFANLGIDNLWIDTFNTHDYPMYHSNYVTPDLLSFLSNKKSNSSYHMSSWKNDSDKIKPLVDSGVLNPYSFHPTRKGHELIANMLIPYFNKFI